METKIFNKSFNDLSFLQNISSLETKYIFVFDFDLTLTNKTSDGIIKDMIDYIELFGSEAKLLKLKEYFKMITNNGHNIYINTRALTRDISNILKNVELESMITEIKGSKNTDNINIPFNMLELEQYNLNNIDNHDMLWAIKKVIHMNDIMIQEKIGYNNILFFDDSLLNINTAKLNGYINSFLIGMNDSGLYGLDYLLIKLEQILLII